MQQDIAKNAHRVHCLQTSHRWVARWIISACLLVSLGWLSACTSSPPQPPTLTVNPTHIAIGSASCSTDNRVCRSLAVVTLRARGQSDLTWSASGKMTLAAGAPWSITFRPSQGTLAPDQMVQVQIVIEGASCPAMATFRFSTPATTVAVQWTCAETNQP